MQIFKKILRRLLRSYFEYLEHKNFINYVSQKKLELEHHAPKVEHLALRGSNADYGFYPEYLENSFNLGLTSTDLHAAYYLYKNNIEQLPHLKNVMVYINAASVGFNLSMTKESYRSIVYNYFFSVPYQTKNKISRKNEKKFLLKCIKRNEVPHSLAWGYAKKTDYGFNTSAQERTRTHLRENKRKPSQIHWLEKLVALGLKNNITIYAVITPVRSDFKALLPEKTELYQSIYQLNSKNLAILDFYDDPRFSDKDLGDTDHLNEQGAKKITQFIAERVHDH
jgi:hypothetical protein